MPHHAPQGEPAHAMPAGYDQAPVAIGGVAAASPEDLADRAAAMPVDAAAAAARPAGDVPAWAQPGLALGLAVLAVTWQLVSFYAREILPTAKASAEFTLSNFDEIVGNAPLLGTSLGGMVGMLLGFGSLILLLLGVRGGIREPMLQAAIGLLGGIALAATVLLPALV
jgi:hypothetical protein